MTQGDRLNALAQLQLRIAAIYAVQNEDMQRQRRQDTQDERHRAVDASRKAIGAQKHRAKRQQRNQDEMPQQTTDISADPDLSLPQDLVNMGSNHAPDALMQEPHFQLAESAGAMTGVDIPQFKQYHGPPKRLRAYRPQ